jgi:hypothetical protein
MNMNNFRNAVGRMAAARGLVPIVLHYNDAATAANISSSNTPGRKSLASVKVPRPRVNWNGSVSHRGKSTVLEPPTRAEE